MAYRAPVDEMLFTLRHAAGFREGSGPMACTISAPTISSTPCLGEAGRIRHRGVAPIDRDGDRPGRDAPRRRGHHGTRLEGGLSRLARRLERPCRHPRSYGGQGLPRALNAACNEMWNAASMAFGLGPTLTMAAVDLCSRPWLRGAQGHLPRQAHLRRMGRHHAAHRAAGRARTSARLRTRAERADDGHYRLFRPEDLHHLWRARPHRNIVHLVLARAARAPAGIKGISLFLVPKFLVDPTAPSARATTCAASRSSTSSGIHGSARPASWPSATMAAPSAIWSARKIAAWPACSP